MLNTSEILSALAPMLRAADLSCRATETDYSNPVESSFYIHFHWGKSPLAYMRINFVFDRKPFMGILEKVSPRLAQMGDEEFCHFLKAKPIEAMATLACYNGKATDYEKLAELYDECRGRALSPKFGF